MIQWFKAFLIKSLLCVQSAVTQTGTEINFENQQLAEELHKSFIRKFEKTYGIFILEVQYLGADKFSKYAWVAPLQEKKDISYLCFPKNFRQI